MTWNKVLNRYLPGCSDKYNGITAQDVPYLGQRSNGASLYYTSRALLLELTCSATLNEDLKLATSRNLWAGPIILILTTVLITF